MKDAAMYCSPRWREKSRSDSHFRYLAVTCTTSDVLFSKFHVASLFHTLIGTSSIIMSTTHTSLDAAATDRKARLAKLAGIKRKQPGSDAPASSLSADTQDGQKQGDESDDTTSKYLSGRNYDIATKNAKLGFENAPVGEEVETVEEQAQRIAAVTAEQAAKDEIEAQKGIDLFKLQPKKPNWDLKRDLDEKMKILNVRTQNAIARLVRARIENSKRQALEMRQSAPTADEDQEEEVGIEGNTLVEGIHLREQEEAREAALEREEEDIPD
jgi:coiled-coil domain-containing protein 12